MSNFRTWENSYNLLEYFQIRISIQMKPGRNAGIQMDLSKNNRFSTQEAINHITHTEKRKKVPVCEMSESSESLSPLLPNLSWKLKIIAYRDRSTIPTSSKLELLSQYEMPSWRYIAMKSFITDDAGGWYPPLVCLFPVQSITKKKSTFTWSKSRKRALEQGVRSVQSRHLRHQNDANLLALVSLLLTLNKFYTLFYNSGQI